MIGLERAQYDERTERDLDTDASEEEGSRTHQLASLPMVVEHVSTVASTKIVTTRRPDAMREMNRDTRIPVGGTRCPNTSGNVGIAIPAFVWRIVAPRMICV